MKLKQIITCLIIGAAISIMAFQQKPGFVIEGYVDEPKEGTMLLITQNAKDTFAKAPIVDGHFRLTGSVDSIVEAALIPEGSKMGALPFSLKTVKISLKFIIIGQIMFLLVRLQEEAFKILRLNFIAFRWLLELRWMRLPRMSIGHNRGYTGRCGACRPSLRTIENSGASW